MRKIDSLIIHCSATKAGVNFGAADIGKWHRNRGLNGIGYHYVVRLDGSVEVGRSVEKIGAHCPGWNERSIGVCYIGGLGAEGHPADTRTKTQEQGLRRLVDTLREQYSITIVMGHRDASPDLNGDGTIEPGEFIKVCPCFDVRKWLLLLLISILFSACGSSRSRMNEYVEENSASMTNYNRKVNLMREVVGETGERMDEHIEQTVFVLEVDTGNMTGQRPPKLFLSIMKQVVEKSRSGLQKVQSNSSFVCVDSSSVVRDSSVKVDRKEEKQQSNDRGVWVWMALIGLLVISVLLFRKFFR